MPTYSGDAKPVSLTNPPKTNRADWWCAGTSASTPTITSTPIRCHHALTSLRKATSCTPNVLSAPWTRRIAPKSRIVCGGVAVKPRWRSRSAFRNEAAPKSMPAVTATWPRKLNQPVNHAHAAACDGASFAAQ